MLFLATGMPQAKQDDAGQIIITIPNGHGEIQIACRPNQALCLGEVARREAARIMLAPEPVSITAALIDFPAPKARKARRIKA